MRKKLSRVLREYAGMLVGAVVFGIAYSWFLIPYKIAPGGIAGLAQIFFHMFGFPAGTAAFIMNIPLFILGAVMLGGGFGWRTFLGMTITNFMTDFFEPRNLARMGIVKDLTKFTFTDQSGHTIYAMLGPGDIYLSAISGSVLLGLGLGLIFRNRGSTGGTDIPVAIIKARTGLSLGTGYWLIESFIILTLGIVFADLKVVIWGYVNLFISAKITDMASEGIPYVKAVYVISEKAHSIRNLIYKELGRGVTFFRAEGGFTQKPYDVIFCVMGRTQVSQMRELVRDVDERAFMIVTDVNDVMGYGFKTRALDFNNGRHTQLQVEDLPLSEVPVKLESKLTIRSGAAADLPSIYAVEKKCYAGIAEAAAVIRRRMEVFPEGFFVATAGTEIAGYISTELWPFTEKPEREHFAVNHWPDGYHDPEGTEAYISSFAVLPAAQGLGIGKRLLSRMEEAVLQAHPKVTSFLVIVAEGWAAARHVYANAGYEEVCHYPEFFADTSAPPPGRRFGGIVMRKKISSTPK